MRSLPVPAPGRPAAERFVADHLANLVSDDVRGSPAFAGGQSAADAALAAYDVSGYARRRNEVHPRSARGASMLSPYIRHGLLTLPEVWAHVSGGPGRDVEKFRDELLWQEFARHWYARLGVATRHGVRHRLPEPVAAVSADSQASSTSPRPSWIFSAWRSRRRWRARACSRSSGARRAPYDVR